MYLHAYYDDVGGKSKVKDGLNDQCISACKAAVRRLRNVCEELESGEIIVKELLITKEREHHLVMLCSAAMQPSISYFSSAQCNLKKRLNELEHYHHHCKLLRHLLSIGNLPEKTRGTQQTT